MKLSVVSTSKSKKEDIVLSDAFVKDYNESLVHQAVVTYLAGMRQGPVSCQQDRLQLLDELEIRYSL